MPPASNKSPDHCTHFRTWILEYHWEAGERGEEWKEERGGRGVAELDITVVFWDQS